ncbi:hypothetical protein K0M31_000467 [Melipona bicolor]|uniref:Uncharacterized protein n=1 Tax=Melipona bicolor TaxID=60889 RepID=A0AA40GEX0_9HYME|nr:hypothetical protein K0M31_000467 [Melipona bicolor]
MQLGNGAVEVLERVFDPRPLLGRRRQETMNSPGGNFRAHATPQVARDGCDSAPEGTGTPDDGAVRGP